MLQAGVIVSGYATLMVEILKDNVRPEAGEVYGTMDMPNGQDVIRVSRPSCGGLLPADHLGRRQTPEM
jgi:hypothetical protein